MFAIIECESCRERFDFICLQPDESGSCPECGAEFHLESNAYTATSEPETHTVDVVPSGPTVPFKNNDRQAKAASAWSPRFVTWCTLFFGPIVGAILLARNLGFMGYDKERKIAYRWIAAGSVPLILSALDVWGLLGNVVSFLVYLASLFLFYHLLKDRFDGFILAGGKKRGVWNGLLNAAALTAGLYVASIVVGVGYYVVQAIQYESGLESTYTLLDQGRFEQAQVQLYDLIEKDNADPRAYIILADLYENAGSPDSSVSVLDALLEVYPDDPDLVVYRDDLIFAYGLHQFQIKSYSIDPSV